MTMKKAFALAFLPVAVLACGGSTTKSAEPATTVVTQPVTTTQAPTTTTTASSVPPAPALPPGAKASDPAQVVAVFQRFEAQPDCGELQKEFDTAAANHDRDSKRGADALAQLDTRYMEAVDKRMRALKCY